MGEATVLQRVLQNTRPEMTPESAALLVVGFFGVVAAGDVVTGQSGLQASAIPFVMLWGISFGRNDSYQVPDRTLSLYSTFYTSLKAPFFFLSAVATDITSGRIIAYVLISFVLFIVYVVVFQKPASRSDDWHQLYKPPSHFTGWGFAALHIRIWPFVTLIAVFGTLFLTGQAGWAVLAGLSCLAFIPSAYARNPLTARPVLSKTLNLLAVCLIAIAAITLIQKGH